VFYKNQLTGSIPSLPASLLTIFLYQNHLTGSIPPLPSSLNWLYLNNNQLTGSIPPLPASLGTLALYHNQLTGDIPTLPASLRNLYLDNNQLESLIPPSITSTAIGSGDLRLCGGDNVFWTGDPTVEAWVQAHDAGWAQFCGNDCLSPGYYEETDSDVYTAGAWSSIGVTGASANQISYSGDANAQAAFCMEGQVLTLHQALYPSFGLMEVCIDGGCQTIDTYSTALEVMQPFNFVNLGSGDHVVVISRVSGSLMALDGIEVISPAPLSTLMGSRFEESNPNIYRTGDWVTYANTGPSGGQLVYSYDSNATVYFRVLGNSLMGARVLAVYHVLYPGFGSMEVCIDGDCQSVSNNGAMLQWQVPSSFPLSDGVQDVVITSQGTGPIAFDAVALGSKPSPPSNLSGSSSQPYHVDLQWTDGSSDERGFRIFRDGQQIGAVGANVTTFTDTLPDCGTLHSYTVQAYNDCGTSSTSNTAYVIPDCPVTLDPGSYEEDYGLSYTGSWGTYTGVGPSANQFYYTGDTSASVSFRINGQSLVLYQTLYSGFGYAQVCIDGGCQYIYTYTPGVVWQQPFTFGNLGSGIHDVTISNVNAMIGIDRIEVLATAEPVPDAPILPQALRLESDDGAVEGVEGWTVVNAADASGGSFLSSGANTSAMLTLTFDGPSITVDYVKREGYGSLAIEVDDEVVQVVDSYLDAGTQIDSFTVDGLGDGQHTLKVYPLSGTVGVDAFTAPLVVPDLVSGLE
ncbi:MAG: hypothetical protein GYB65_20285, partial [Chloroflexi bacterium]|nr:hypothetical protein [Chloroflexota bacterium]